MTPEGLLAFWFSAHARKHWFRSTPAFDREVREGFERIWNDARTDGLSTWQQTAKGLLALVILLDQMPLHMFRGQAQSFASEALSRVVADAAISQGFDVDYEDEEKAFLYLPFMHSEDLADQDRSVALFQQAGLSDSLRWARHHREIVRRFGRFPHRNRILGRVSTPGELAWLDSPEAFNP